MIPREIFKKIRQIEIRTNRIVTETLAGAIGKEAKSLTAKYANHAKKEEALWLCSVRVFRVFRG